MNITRECPVCHLPSRLENVNSKAWLAWKVGQPIAGAFPYWPPAVREQLASGTHPDCQKAGL